MIQSNCENSPGQLRRPFFKENKFKAGLDKPQVAMATRGFILTHTLHALTPSPLLCILGSDCPSVGPKLAQRVQPGRGVGGERAHTLVHSPPLLVVVPADRLPCPSRPGKNVLQCDLHYSLEPKGNIRGLLDPECLIKESLSPKKIIMGDFLSPM